MVQTSPPATRVVRPRTAWHLGILVAAPVVALVARLLNTPWYQHDDDSPDNARVLSEVAGATARNDLGMVLTLLSALLFAAAAAVVWSRVRERAPRVGGTGVVLAVVGTYGLAQFADQLVVVGQAARLEEHRPAMLALLEQMYEAEQTGLSFLMLLLGALGWVLLGVALYRSRLVPRAAAVLTAVGSAGVLVTAPGPLVSFIAGAAVISLVGLLWTAAAFRDR